MKVVQINATCGTGSTGKICGGISDLLSANQIENYILYSSKSSGHKLGIGCSNEKYIKIQALKSRILGNYGFNSKKATKKMIAELERIQPSIVHLHNIHGHDCNLEKLFSFLKKNNIKIVWTFHDCWAFTGYCMYFDLVRCDKWQKACSGCPQKKDYSWFIDRSRQLFKRKKRLFKNLDLTIVTPSEWLAKLTRQSFLKDYSVNVINNGIDLNVFKPYESNFRQRYDIENKKIVLGVSMGWEKRKGLDVFIDLSQKLSEEYQIVLIGTDKKTDELLPANIISIHRTNNQRELAEIYAAADVFVNPTREENYPTVNLESVACGTPVITFETGGSPEMIDETCGAVVDCDDIDALEKQIIRVCEEKPYSKGQCLSKAKTFDQNERFKEYIDLYERVIVTKT